MTGADDHTRIFADDDAEQLKRSYEEAAAGEGQEDDNYTRIFTDEDAMQLKNSLGAYPENENRDSDAAAGDIGDGLKETEISIAEKVRKALNEEFVTSSSEENAGQTAESAAVVLSTTAEIRAAINADMAELAKEIGAESSIVVPAFDEEETSLSSVAQSRQSTDTETGMQGNGKKGVSGGQKRADSVRTAAGASGRNSSQTRTSNTSQGRAASSSARNRSSAGTAGNSGTHTAASAKKAGNGSTHTAASARTAGNGSTHTAASAKTTGNGGAHTAASAKTTGNSGAKSTSAGKNAAGSARTAAGVPRKGEGTTSEKRKRRKKSKYVTRTTGQKIRTIVISVLIWAIVIVACYGGYKFGYTIFYDVAVDESDISQVSITITGEETDEEIGEILLELDMIEDMNIFLVRCKLYNAEYIAGSYTLSRSYNTEKILNILAGYDYSEGQLTE